MPKGTFAILRNQIEQLHNHGRMSIGEIAMVLYKSEAQLLGQVVNMSFGGVAFESSSCRFPINSKLELDLLMAEKGIYLHNIPFTIPPMASNAKKKKETETRQRAVLRFKKLNTRLRNGMQELMAHHID